MLARKSSSPTTQPEDQSSRVEHLRAVSLFADIKDQPGALEAISGLMTTRSFEPKENIIKEGDTGSEMYVLIAGDAAVFKSTSEGDQYKVFIFQGANHPVFGEGGLLDSDARSATIRAETPCECLVLDRAAFDDFCKKHPQWALPISLKIARAVMARFRKTNNDLLLLYNALIAEIRG